ncbi:lecithin retinol acyltransferase family protein [Ferrovibrio sp.]|uniref:lecithin retinol acyltransferase family protein n=1 Tax=Ferrovibrio sp. TaxID=1917215 RepID=UPI000CB2F16E|nr:MAG: hypothetical protein CTR53_07860 [Ferrovibrio sp.]
MLDISSKRPRLPIGSHVAIRRPAGYTHHGVYIGRYTIIHHSGLSENIFARKGPICETSVEKFLSDGQWHVIQYPKGQSLPKNKVVENAKSRLGEIGYDLFSGNCEHFATWCKTGIAQSKQVDAFLKLGAVGVLIHNFEW